MNPDQTAPFGSSLIWVHIVTKYIKQKKEKTIVRNSGVKAKNSFNSAPKNLPI